MVSEGGVSHSRPVLSVGLCPDWDQWDQSKPVDNAREAMQQADDWLGIPQVPTQFPCSCLRTQESQKLLPQFHQHHHHDQLITH